MRRRRGGCAARRRTTNRAAADRTARTGPRRGRSPRRRQSSRGRAPAGRPRGASSRRRRGPAARPTSRSRNATGRSARTFARAAGSRSPRRCRRRVSARGQPTPKNASAGTPEQGTRRTRRAARTGYCFWSDGGVVSGACAGFFPVFGLGALAFAPFLLALPITSIFSARFEAGSKVARTGVPWRMAERSLVLDPLLSTIWVLSSTVSVMRSPWRELITTLLLSGSTFDTRPTADFRLAELLAVRSVERFDPEVPIELSLGAVPLWP